MISNEWTATSAFLPHRRRASRRETARQDEVVGFDGDRWSGAAWLAFRGDRVTWRDHFVCSRDLCLVGKTVVVPAGGRTIFLDDAGPTPQLRAVGKRVFDRVDVEVAGAEAHQEYPGKRGDLPGQAEAFDGALLRFGRGPRGIGFRRLPKMCLDFLGDA